jgi:hypothetical protein
MRTGTPVLRFGGPARARVCRARTAAALLLLAAGSASCGQLQRQGQASSYLIVNALEAARGDDPATFGGFLHSDVVTVVDDVPTIFNDVGRVKLVLAMKDPGSSTSPTQPSSANLITLNRYHVRFRRADGRNTEGVDVPYAFDGGMTLTVGTTESAGAFEIVRHIAKEEAPLKALGASGLIITTIAEVTFYGHDQTGREVSVTGSMTVEFGNCADPKK